MLDVVECAALEVLDQVRRHTEYPADLLNIELPRRKKLAILRRQADGLIGHALFEHGDLVRVVCTAIHVGPVLTDFLRILQHAGVFKHTGRLRSVAKKRAAVFLDSNRGAQRVLHHGNG